MTTIYRPLLAVVLVLALSLLGTPIEAKNPAVPTSSLAPVEQPSLDAFPSTSGTPAATYEEDHPAITLTGNWTRVSDSRASGGAYIYSETPGDTLEFTFTGDSLVLYRIIAMDGSRAEVRLDGAYLGVLHSWLEEERWQIPAIFDNLGGGKHTFSLKVIAPPPNTVLRRVYVDAFAVPSTHTPSDSQQQAIERVNYHRALAGIPPARGVQAIHEGAQAHSEFVALNRDDPRMEGLGGHLEHPDLLGYTGRTSSDRARYFGYTGGVGEDFYWGVSDPVSSVDGWIEAPYHRNLIMCYGCIEAGYGAVDDYRGRFATLNMGSRTWIAPSQRLIYTYPANGQQNAPYKFGGGEVPEPLPGVQYPVGYAVSIHIAQPTVSNMRKNTPTRFPWMAPQLVDGGQWNLEVAELRGPDGQLVPSYLLDQETDANNALGPDNAFLIAHQPLLLNASYTARMTGTDSQGVHFDHSWSFTTEPAAGIHGGSVTSGACGATVSWTTAGEANSWIEYGPTPSYGSQTSQMGGNPYHYYQTTLTGLNANTTYHYRIVSQDGQGNTRMTEDRTFSTRAVQVLNVPSDYDTIAEAMRGARSCDIVQLGQGIYHERVRIPAGVVLRGNGIDSTTIHGDGGGTDGSVVFAGSDSRIEGLTITGSGPNYWDSGIWHSEGNVTIRNTRLLGNSQGIVSWCFDTSACQLSATIENNTFINNTNSAVDVHELAVHRIVNNTIVGNGRGLVLKNTNTVVENNIVVQNRNEGLTGNQGPTVRYNDVWGNGQDYVNISPGEGAISADPLFAGLDNYALQADSPARDAGNPDGSYNDPDGSRNDLGAYGGPYANAGAVPPTLRIVSTQVNPPQPTGSEPIVLTLQLSNIGGRADEVRVTAAVPDGASYVVGSATVSHGTIQGTGPIVFEVGTLSTNASVTLQYAIRMDSPPARPVTLNAPVTVGWEGGTLTYTFNVLVNGHALYLPTLMR